MWTGCLTALITPFHQQRVDETALRRLVQQQVDGGIHGLVPLGTTGESPTVNDDEYARILDIVIEEVAGRVPVMAGVDSNNPMHAIHLAHLAERAGADALLAVAGYYNRPAQDGLYAHFKTLHDATTLPIFIYNVPPRTIVDVQPETMARLAQLPRVVGVKDATGDLTRISEESSLIHGDFAYLSGDDSTALAYNVQGGRGCISVLSNILPAQCVALQNACAQGDYASALAIHRQLYPLMCALFLEPSPAGVKYAAALLGMCHAECRLPIMPLSPATMQRIEHELQVLGLL